MDVLQQKFGRKPLQFQPEELNAEHISDEEYQVLNKEGGESINEAKLLEKLDFLVGTYYQSSLGKDPGDLSLEKKLKKIKWVDHLAIKDQEIDLSMDDLQNDFKRELVFYNTALENAKTGIKQLGELNIPIWRPSDFRAEMFKTDEHMKKVQNNLIQAKKRIEIVEKRKEAVHKKKFSNNAHKKHVEAKQRQAIENSKKKKKMRPGKNRRQKQRNNKK
ncbi:unnamed protein product [Blepharisma stoltei]|uniref:Uncharacterized protein n=1 Tax=Blepharisma stoltei TaxID=1481888 RepID=A0AAU9JKI5_9CILI|nr:unnamed protein product [Blepharisma stoltei]